MSKNQVALELSETSEVSYLYELPFNSPRINGTKRIGPHRQDVYSIIFGSLLGDGHMEKQRGIFAEIPPKIL